MKNKDDILSLRRRLETYATEQQRMAADPQKSVWVGASAGTGKTKVLSDRVLRLLLSGGSPAKILCLTYTKAAAVEMNSRVAERLGKWAIMEDADLENELLKLYGNLPDHLSERNALKSKARQLFAILLDTPGGIKIQTIHSFCQEVLKRFPLEAGISPYFEVMDDRGALEAVNNVKLHLIEQAIKYPDTPIGQAMAFFTSHVSEYAFPEVINSLINNRSKIARMISDNGGKESFIETVSQRLKVKDGTTQEQIIHDFFANAPYDDLRKLASAGMENIAPWVDGSAKVEDFAEYSNIFLTSGKLRSISRIKILSHNPELANIFTAEGERCICLSEQIKSLRVFQSTKALILLADELIGGYNTFKHNHAKMDYDDMILLTRNLLENKDVARWVLFKLDGGIDNILIDEAQDTSPDQWAIVQAISDEFFAGLGSSDHNRTIFAVGDRKQSIYSFQGADPDKFDEMREHFASLTPNFAKVNLEISFRSAPAVIAAVNQLFNNHEVSRGVASEGENINHIPYREGEGGEVEFWELIEPEEEKTPDEWVPPIERFHSISTSSQMAKMIAHKIKNMVQSGEMLSSKARPLCYGDFLILVRSRDALCEEIIRECKELNINISGIDRINLIEQIAVQDLISLGKFLLLPDDDLSLAEVLKSPLFGLDDDDLFKLCYQRTGSLWSSLLSHNDYQHIADEIKKLFNMVDYHRPFELYNYILGEMGGRKKFYSRMGPEAEDGIDEFINLSQSFEQNHIPTLQNFIEWITSGDIEIKRELEQGQNNMVRIMTVHGSKGLQAPVVILPDTTRIPKCKREAGFLWSDDIFLYPSSSGDYNNYCDSIKEHEKIKMLEEYRRLMYVAVTRAEDRMIFCGFRKKNKASEESWYQLFKNSFTHIAKVDEKQKVWTYRSNQDIEQENKNPLSQEPAIEPIPNFMHTPAAKEKPLSKPLTPSKPDEEPAVVSPLTIRDDSHFFKRGSIIHKLLQIIPDILAENRRSFIAEFLKHKAPEFDAEEITAEVMNLLDNNEFGGVFGANSKAEVPIMGEINGKIVSGQIDRLIINQDNIIVVDFKTNRRPPQNAADIPEVYRSQLGAYKALLQKIYPDKEVKTFILWTNTAQIMPL